jgi:hypothetical protein
MDRDAIARVAKQVARTFTEMSGARPAVKSQVPQSGGREKFLLTFKGKCSVTLGQQQAARRPAATFLGYLSIGPNPPFPVPAGAVLVDSGQSPLGPLVRRRPRSGGRYQASRSRG